MCAPYTRVLFHYALLHCVYLVQRLVFFAYTARFILLNSYMTPHFRSTKKPVSSLCEPVVGAVFVRDGNFKDNNCCMSRVCKRWVVSACAFSHVGGNRSSKTPVSSL